MQRVLSRSVHGRLYLAADETGRPVAIKELVFAHAPDATKVDAFERESRLLGALSHPRIPRLRAAFAEGEGAQVRFYLVQDYVPGESLQARLEHHRYDEAEARELAREVLRILDFLHSRQPPVLHRDLKPANLIRREDGAIVLVDFGSARVLQEGPTHEATLNGTFGYMPPEQLGGSVSPRSDLYALGATLLHLLSRRSPETLLGEDWELAFPREVHVSAPFRAFLRKLVARRPEDRFPSASAALESLEPPLPRAFPRGPLVAAGAVLLLGVGVFLGARGSAVPAVSPGSSSRVSAWVSAPQTPETPPEPPSKALSVAKPVAWWPLSESGGSPSLYPEAGGGPPLRGSEVDAVPGVEGSAVLLGGKGFLVLEPPEGGSPWSGSLAEGALSLWLSRELPGAGPVVTTYAGARRVLQLRLDEEGRLLFVLGGRWMMSPDPLPTGRFTHVALVWGPTGSSLWVNGARVAQDAVPAPAGGIGEGLRMGWDALAPEEMAPALAVDEVRLRASRPPPDTWYHEAIGHDAFASEGPVLGRIWPPVRLRMASSGEIELPPGPSPSGSPGDCARPRRLHLDGMELSTGTDHKTYLSLLFSFDLGAGCSATVPLVVEGTPLERASFTDMHLSQGRQQEGHHTETLALRAARRYSEVGIGNREESSQRGDIDPVVKFWIDWASRTVHRTVHVEGRLVDARKQPLTEFSVLAFPEELPLPLVEVKTGPDGWYHLDLPPGTWTVGPRMREIQVEEGAGTLRIPEMQEEPREYWSSPGRRELRGL